jgi:hypothetical protein
MSKGAFEQFIVRNQDIESFMKIYEQVLIQYEFKIIEKKCEEVHIQHKAIFGSKAKSFLFSRFVPMGLGCSFEEGNRYGAETEIKQNGNHLDLKILIVPYMSIFDKHDVFLISQRIGENMLDDDWCWRQMTFLIFSLKSYGLQIDRNLFIR